MATLEQIHALVVGTPVLEQRFLAARIKASWDIINEDPDTTNHANRLAWAEANIADYHRDTGPEYRLFLSNPTIQTNGSASSDNDAQYVVNSMVDIWANALVGA